MGDDLIDRLLARPGRYVGQSLQVPEQLKSAARIEVRPLPGRSGVSLDYEGISEHPRRPLTHAEHSVLGRTSSGLALYCAHIHGGGSWGGPMLTELRETEPGYFVAVDGSSPFPLAIRIEAPSSGRLVYTWCFAEPGGEIGVRNTAELSHVD